MYIGKFSGYSAGDCSFCTSGRYSSENSSTVCLVCAAGRYAASSGATDCALCGKGYFQTATSQTGCIGCSKGTYASSEGSTSCANCPTGYYSKRYAADCNEAAEGYYLNAWDSGVKECPSHGTCLGYSFTPQPEVNYWVERRSLKYQGEILRCPRATCIGSGDQAKNSSSLCWKKEAYNVSSSVYADCSNDDSLQCVIGSYGPLCGSCQVNYVYSSVKQYCVSCDTSLVILILICCMLVCSVLFVVILKYTNFASRYCGILCSSQLVTLLRKADSGTLRILFNNYQIIQSISWNLDIVFPYPFSDLLEFFSLFSFDFISFDCMFTSSAEYYSVVVWSTIPIGFAIINYVVYRIKVKLLESPFLDDKEIWKLQGDHTYYFLLLTYLVLPPVSLKLFQALDCITVADRSYLRVDTSVDCTSGSYGVFRVFDALFIVIYMTVPIVWLVLLTRLRAELNPAPDHMKLSCYLRDNNDDLLPIRFLFSPYLPCFYYFEPLEM